ncbi:hypothetical protein X797_010336 [Metarhizium robertsii]|uniref:F-box domain-containing protein n=2 Tax=Metarhizium robertsii TaxID=568076 RepID=A0A0B2X7D1_METRA|nr:uncharacterized protein MAA_11589 [Metarhizium robertsii ARSEF 23]EXU96525.1 hypothetical protein X797_010336 [Metarhizium robertsii]KHO10828.1 hypothetical protein MAA_11589 [Metarhizium robertsii ARSEF 23]
MSGHSLEPEELISRLSHRPSHLIRAMIKMPDANAAAPSRRVRADRVSSLGALDRLPPEIMSMVLGMLDIQSNVHFAAVSCRASAFVQSQRAYRDLVAIAPQALAALPKVGLLGLHSITKLHGALRTQRCAACTEYGPFLFLPTGERCCWECLRYHPSFRMVLPREAKRYFGLGERHLKQLPTLHVIPGRYGISPNVAPENCRLVSAKLARALGLTLHGSAEKLSQALARTCKSAGLLATGRYFQSEPEVPPGQDSLLLPCQGNIPPDKFFGMASIPFPSLSKSGRIEQGLWCRGCETVLRLHDSLRLPSEVLVAVVPGSLEPMRVLLGLERRARSRESFLHHVRHCYGARQMVPELAAGME